MNKLTEGKDLAQLKALAWDMSGERNRVQAEAQTKLDELTKQLESVLVAIKAEEAK